MLPRKNMIDNLTKVDRPDTTSKMSENTSESDSREAKRYKGHNGDKSLGSKRNLTFHQSIHTGFKPFTCSHCGKSFRLKHNLDEHIQTHNDNCGNTFECGECGEKFTTKDNL